MRLIVREERPHSGAQLRFTDADGMRITCLLPTNTPGKAIAGLELSHRQRARCKDRIRNAHDTGLRNLPLHDFARNQIWLEIGLFLSLCPERVQDGRGEPGSPDVAPVQRGSRTPPRRILSSLRADVGIPAGRSGLALAASARASRVQ